MHNLEKIKERLIVKGYSDLLNVEILINYVKNLKGCYFECEHKEDEVYSVGVDTEMKTAPISVVEGGISHELAHIVTMKSRTKQEDVQNTRLSRFNLYSLLEERNTDLIAIQRGFGEKLLAYTNWYVKTHNSFDRAIGLSPLEIKTLLHPRKF